jgi:hypothetical protein
MVVLDYLAAARFTGAEATTFLQSQLSADIAAVAPGGAVYAAYCTPKGQVIGLLLVCRLESEFLVAGSSVLLPAILARLKMYVFRTPVEFAPEPDLAVLGGSDSPESPGGDVFRPGPEGLAYAFASNEPHRPGSGEPFRALELSRGVAWLGGETTEKFIPQMLGHDRIGAVSFSKGCYPGQEIVARARYLGRVKRKPVVVRTSEPLDVAPAEHVGLQRDGNESQGVVVDSAALNGGTVLFVVAPDEPGATTRTVRYGDRSYRCATM